MKFLDNVKLQIIKLNTYFSVPNVEHNHIKLSNQNLMVNTYNFSKCVGKRDLHRLL